MALQDVTAECLLDTVEGIRILCRLSEIAGEDVGELSPSEQRMHESTVDMLRTVYGVGMQFIMSSRSECAPFLDKVDFESLRLPRNASPRDIKLGAEAVLEAVDDSLRKGIRP